MRRRQPEAGVRGFRRCGYRRTGRSRAIAKQKTVTTTSAVGLAVTAADAIKDNGAGKTTGHVNIAKGIGGYAVTTGDPAGRVGRLGIGIRAISIIFSQKRIAAARVAISLAIAAANAVKNDGIDKITG